MPQVSTKIHRPGATILLDQSSKANSLSPNLVGELDQALDDLHQEKHVRFVILAGAGEHFCSGLDIAMLHQATTAEDPAAAQRVYEYWARVADLLAKMLRFPKPIIAAVDGHAIGAGLALMLAADVAIASDRSRFGTGAIRLGLISGLAAPLLNFRVGAAVAAQMLIASEPIEANRALAHGMIAEIVSSDQIWVAASQYGARCDAGPAESFQASKRLLNESIGEQLFSQLTIGAGLGATACSTAAAREGLAAFVEKRPANWPR
jgi:enoyl-CoA hydratase/carnithine racemase